MIKNFETYINEDYFSKLASRKDNGDVRKENEVTEDFVRSFVDNDFKRLIKSITIRKENGKTFVDIVGNFILRSDVEEIPFQFGKVTGNFDYSRTNIASLNGCPKEVGGHFYCYGCEKLTSLEGCPEKIGGGFECDGCSLTSLEGCPKVCSYFSCSKCENLTSLEGCPQEVNGLFDCSNCENLTSLEGCPKEVGGDFCCYNCGKQFTEEEVRELCNVKNRINAW